MNYCVYTHTELGFDFPAGLRTIDVIPEYIRSICQSTEGCERPWFLRYLPLPGEGGYLALGIPSLTLEAQPRYCVTMLNYCLNHDECRTLFSDGALSYLERLLHAGVCEKTQAEYKTNPEAFWRDICQASQRGKALHRSKATLSGMDRSILFSVALNYQDIGHLILSHTPEHYSPDGTDSLFRVLQWLPAELRPNALSFHTDLRSKDELDPFTKLVLVSAQELRVNRTVSAATPASDYIPQGLESYRTLVDSLMELPAQSKQIPSILIPAPKAPATEAAPMIQQSPAPPKKRSAPKNIPTPEAPSIPAVQLPEESPSLLGKLFQITIQVLMGLLLVFLAFLAAQSVWNRGWLETLVSKIQDPLVLQSMLVWMFSVLLAVVAVLLGIIALLVTLLLKPKKTRRK